MSANLGYETALLGAVLRGYPDIAALARTIGHADFDQARHVGVWQDNRLSVGELASAFAKGG